MDEEIQTEETMTEAMGGSEDSAVIRALRDEVKSLKAEAKAAAQRAEAIAEQTRNEIKRESKAREIVSDLGYPLMAQDVVEKVEGELTAEAVAAFLESRGLQPQVSEGNESQVQAEAPSGLSSVASLGQQVANVASGGGPQSIAQRVQVDLDNASTPEEIAAAMARAGLTHPR